MYRNVNTSLLWIRLLAKELVNKWNLKRSKYDSWILFLKDEKGKFKLVISVHVDEVFIARNTETLKFIKEEIKQKFNISDSRKVK